ncbi:HET-domain-containing protein [Ophiobolus disseminans]|uniref:HET-domain-containing protein n=1 Tax=Ophiobolus disseminans TaxID=1469910 RepID=A0A6A6ZLL0_9PLEO|nr:HET-domain-containing protein [Ophiobolus disseminans]
MRMEAAAPEPIPCTNCRKIADHIRAWTECIRLEQQVGYLTYKTVGLWKDFANAHECPHCVILVQSFSKVVKLRGYGGGFLPEASDPDYPVWHESENLRAHSGDLLEFFGEEKDNRFSLWRRRGGKGSRGKPRSGLYLIPPQPYGPVIGGHHVETPAANGNIDIRQIKRWLSLCDREHHGQCHSIDPNQFFQCPTSITLIDLKNKRLVFCETKERYAALSYVWGKTKVAFEALKSNISDLSAEGGLLKHYDKLPATIKDAMILCNSLDVPYLWVDRLCIIQDDESSKRQNISWMASIYAHCYLALVATEGSHDNHGIRGIGATSGPREGNITFQFDDIQCGREKIYESRSVYHTRGWTFQERVLARRCLVFHDGRVHWECEKSCIQENFDKADYDYETYSSAEGYSFELKSWPDPYQYGLLYREFSDRMLTFESDVMDAFSSTTTALTRSFPGGFLYAMPEYMFTLSLLWEFGTDAEPTRRAWLPSWSCMGWAKSLSSMAHLPNPILEDYEVWDDNISHMNYEPMSCWWKRNTSTGEMVGIDDSYHTWGKYEPNPTALLPAGWTFIPPEEPSSGETTNKAIFQGGFVHKKLTLNDAMIRFSRPVPFASPGPIIPDLNIWDTSIHGVVSRVQLIFGKKYKKSSDRVSMLSAPGEKVGFVDICCNEVQQIKYGDECIVIALCRGYKVFNWRGSNWGYGEPAVDVMRIIYDGDVAYRGGIGSVPLELWTKLDVEEVKIVLG